MRRLISWQMALSLSFLVMTASLPGRAQAYSVGNNKFGMNAIRFFDGCYLGAVSQMVNSNGGDWGYVTVLLLSEDRANPARVQGLLDNARRYHLIPILRLGTRWDGASWARPAQDEAMQWRDFLVKLNYPTAATYMVVGNEPNLGLEWGGTPDPAGYARYLQSFEDTFSALRNRFKILNGAMDLSNPTGKGMMDEYDFLAAMQEAVPDVFTRLDGWASNPYQFYEGRGLRYTYRGYLQELDFLGINLPVFITESYTGATTDPMEVASFYQEAFDFWLNDPKVVAATPNFYNPEAQRFWMFDADASGNAVNLSPTAEMIRHIPKVAGSPTLVMSALALPSVLPLVAPTPQVSSLPDYPIQGGHFYTQASGGKAPKGYAITDEAGIPFWSAFQQMGGVDVLGYPVSRRFMMDGFVCQAMQKLVLQWRPERGQVWLLNTFDLLHDEGRDDWLMVYRQTPRPFNTSPDTGLSWDQVVARHQSFLDQNEAIKQLYFADPDPVSHFGLPVSYADEGNSFVIRAQRATFQYWKEDVPWAKAGDVTMANGGDLAKEAGVLPRESTMPESPPVSQ